MTRTRLTDKQLAMLEETRASDEAVIALIQEVRQSRPPLAEPDAESYREVFGMRWRELVTDGQGNLDPDAIARELYDYAWLQWSVAKVYDALTGGQISLPETRPETVISEATEHAADAVMDGIRDELRQLQIAVMNLPPTAHPGTVLTLLRERLQELEKIQEGTND